MNILIITLNVGRNAPGIVFERLIHGLSEMHTIDVITADWDPSIDLSKVRKVDKIKRTELHRKVETFLIARFALNPFDVVWARKAARIAGTRQDYDLVFSFICFSHYIALIAGNRIARMLGLRQFVYSVDAIPAPIGWLKNDAFFRGTKRLISKYLQKAHGLFSANEQMLAYQLGTFKPKPGLVTGVIYNPSFGGRREYPLPAAGNYTFLFTGGLYGPRKPQYILGAFKNILAEFPGATLEFVGSSLAENCFSELQESERRQVIVHPFTKDLEPFYQRATALIDIDADLENDVFLSSKITNYITINRIIISETGADSPSRNIFRGIPSILQCGHDVDELTIAMRRAILQRDGMNFDDRSGVIALFDLKNIVGRINPKISA